MKRIVSAITILSLLLSTSMTVFALPTKEEVNNVNGRAVFMTLVKYDETTKLLGERVSTYDPTMQFSITPDNSLYFTGETFLTGDKYDLIPSGYRIAIGWWDDQHTVYTVPDPVEPEDQPIGIKGDGVIQDKEFIKASRTDIRNWDLSATVRTGKNQKLVVEDVKVVFDGQNNAYIDFTLQPSYTAIGNKDYEIELQLKCGSRNLKETAYTISGELANQVYEVYADDTEIYMDDYNLIRAEETVRNATIFLDCGIELRKVNLMKGRDYLIHATNDFTSKDENIFINYEEIEDMIRLKTLNLTGAIEVWYDDANFWAYGLETEGDTDIVELGKTNAALPLKETYYLASKQISAEKLGTTANSEEEDIEDEPDVPVGTEATHAAENSQTYQNKTDGVRTYDAELKSMNGKVVYGEDVRYYVASWANRELAVVVRSKALNNATATGVPWAYNYNAVLNGSTAVDVADSGKAYTIKSKLGANANGDLYGAALRQLYSAVTMNNNYNGLSKEGSLQYVGLDDKYEMRLIQNTAGYYTGIVFTPTDKAVNYASATDEPETGTGTVGNEYWGPNENPMTGRLLIPEMWEILHNELKSK